MPRARESARWCPRRRSTRDRLIDRSALAIATPTSTTTSPKMPSRISRPAVLVELLPEQDLEHDRRQPDPWEEAKRQRGEQAGSDDDEQVGEHRQRISRAGCYTDGLRGVRMFVLSICAPRRVMICAGATLTTLFIARLAEADGQARWISPPDRPAGLFDTDREALSLRVAPGNSARSFSRRCGRGDLGWAIRSVRWTPASAISVTSLTRSRPGRAVRGWAGRGRGSRSAGRRGV